jgi:glycerol-3-phosphate acyltransferase PlsY
MTTLAWLWIPVAYLLGSIPFALLIGKVKGVDIRTVGSGNVGATNLGRAVGKKWGIVCFFLDAGKGLAAVLLAGFVQGWVGQPGLSPLWSWLWLGVAAGAVAGHMFPVWLKFKGGKGVATGLGALLGFFPLVTVPALGAFLTWLAVLGIYRIVGLASVVAAGALPLYIAAGTAIAGRPWAEALPYLIVVTALCGLVIFRHRSNLRRLIRGEEPDIRGETHA